jgi:hypothetical protein
MIDRPFRRILARSSVALLALGVASAPAPARAQTGDAAVAEALFRTARTLVAAGNYAEACPKFAESQRIDPKLGTLMNLALCHANEGKTASAWAEYTQAAELAARAGQGERERVARKSASDLEAALPHVVLKSATKDSITVTWDGKPMGAAVLGIPLPVDPGVHELVASATGRQTYKQTVTVKSGPGEQVVTIPELAPGVTAAPVVVGPVPAPTPPVTPPPSEPEATGHPILGYSLLGGGAVAIIIGSVFGGLALSEKSTVAGQCNPKGQCTQGGLNAATTLKTDEATSTVMIGLGIVSAGAGAYFVITSHSKKEASPSAPTARVEPLIGPGVAGMGLSGTF